jgi:hypothetical protein
MGEAIAEKPVCQGLVAPLLMRSSEIESTCGELPGILQAAGQERGIAQASNRDYIT